MNWTDHFKQRLLFGTSQAFVKQLEKGEEYKCLQPVYGLGIVAEIYEKTTSEWYHHYQLVKKSDAENSQGCPIKSDVYLGTDVKSSH